jgi:hypothetical protein
MAEYEGLLAGLQAAVGLGVCHLLIKRHSQLVVNQVSKEYQRANQQMAAYVAEVQRMGRHFDRLELEHVPHKENTEADELSWLASSRAPLSPWVFEERLCRPTVTVANYVEGGTPPLSGGDQAMPLTRNTML